MTEVCIKAGTSLTTRVPVVQGRNGKKKLRPNDKSENRDTVDILIYIAVEAQYRNFNQCKIKIMVIQK